MPGRIPVRNFARSSHAQHIDPLAELDAAHAERTTPPVVIVDNGVTNDDSDIIRNMEPLEGDLERARELGELASGTSGGTRNVIQSGAASQNIGRTITIDKTTSASLDPNTNLRNGVRTDLGSLDWGNPQVILDINGDDAASSVVSIQLTSPVIFGNQFLGPQTLDTLQPVAIIEYGSGGSRNKVEIDWINGHIIEVPGSAVRVSARADLITNGQAPRSFQLGAFVVSGEKAKFVKPVKSFYLGNLAGPNGNIIVPVPPNAVDVQLIYTRGFAGQPPDAQIIMEFQPIGLAAGTPVPSTNMVDGYNKPFPLCGAMEAVKVSNKDAGATTLNGAFLVFGIDL